MTIEATDQTTRKPERIRLQRTKGWRKPEGAIVVARPTRWGNPFRRADRAEAERVYRRWVTTELVAQERRRYQPWPEPQISLRLPMYPDIIAELRGYDLACWCPLDQPCHADVLLEVANR